MHKRLKSNTNYDSKASLSNTDTQENQQTSYLSRMNNKMAKKKKKMISAAYSFGGVKEMVIDFVCREDLIITTLKEFFEVFISSIKKEQIFHRELLHPAYNNIGISI
jgi:hypothetical protein